MSRIVDAYFEIVPYNPARHGIPIENLRATSRHGNILFLFGMFFAALAAVLYIFMIHNATEPPSQLASWGVWGILAMAILFMVVGLYFILAARERNAAVYRLRNSGKGRVTRGVITAVRNTYRLFGKTPFTSKGDMMGGMDTGWFFQVTYKFEDKGGNLRIATGTIPDLVGPQRHKRMETTRVLDMEMPRRGQHVDVLFDAEMSVILKLVAQTF
ncbi:MAG: hypothetical protein FWE31_03050 [Firmicutes bacterium]|nr:hypothetical protein [Bacillota bacterium]